MTEVICLMSAILEDGLKVGHPELFFFIFAGLGDNVDQYVIANLYANVHTFVQLVTIMSFFPVMYICSEIL